MPSYLQLLSVILPFAGGLIGALIAPLVLERYRHLSAKKESVERDLIALRNDLRHTFGVIDLIISVEKLYEGDKTKLQIARISLSGIALSDVESKLYKTASLSESFFKDLLLLILLARYVLQCEIDNVRKDSISFLRDHYYRTRVQFGALYKDKLKEDILTASGIDNTYSQAGIEYDKLKQKEEGSKAAKEVEKLKELGIDL